MRLRTNSSKRTGESRLLRVESPGKPCGQAFFVENHCGAQARFFRRIERNLSDKQRALLFLSGVSLIGCRALLSGISSVELTR
jgi:hypothetical protein